MITLVSISLKDPLTDHLHISLGETNIMPHVDQDSVQLLQNLQLSVAQVTMEFQAVMETLKGKKKDIFYLAHVAGPKETSYTQIWTHGAVCQICSFDSSLHLETCHCL